MKKKYTTQVSIPENIFYYLLDVTNGTPPLFSAPIEHLFDMFKSDYLTDNQYVIEMKSIQQKHSIIDIDIDLIKSLTLNEKVHIYCEICLFWSFNNIIYPTKYGDRATDRFFVSSENKTAPISSLINKANSKIETFVPESISAKSWLFLLCSLFDGLVVLPQYKNSIYKRILKSLANKKLNDSIDSHWVLDFIFNEDNVKIEFSKKDVQSFKNISITDQISLYKNVLLIFNCANNNCLDTIDFTKIIRKYKLEQLIEIGGNVA